jgi:hypothetical protein
MNINSNNNNNNNNVNPVFFLNYMDRCAAEVDYWETGCRTLLGIETPHFQALKLINDVAFVYIYDLFGYTGIGADCTGWTVGFIGE